MDVDRHKFLLLTAAIAAATTGGCAPKVGSDIPPAATPTPRDDPSVDVGSSDISDRMVGVLGGDSVGTDGAAGPVDEYGYAVDEYGYPVDEYGHPIDEYGPADEYGYPIGEYGPVDEYGYPIAEYGPVDEYGYGPPQAEYYPPAKPKKVDQRCRRLKAPGPTCESFEDTKQNCGAIVRTMDKKTADRAVSCLQRKSGTRAMCSWDISGKCVESSLKNAKIDSQSSRDCRLAERKCGGVSSFDGRTCRAAVSSVKPEFRDRVAACIAEFCEIGTCFYYLD